MTSAWRTRTSSKGGVLVLKGVNRGTRTGEGVHGQLGVLLCLLDIVGVIFVIPDQVGLARLQAREAGLRVGQRLQDDPVEKDLALVPIVGVLFQDHAIASGPGFQDIGAGATGLRL